MGEFEGFINVGALQLLKEESIAALEKLEVAAKEAIDLGFSVQVNISGGPFSNLENHPEIWAQSHP